jgi:hypothetical protein
MEYKLTNEQLFNSFKSIMREYSELESAEKSYDYYDYEKSNYVDANVVNYYEDLEEDWESDDWIFQVQYDKGDWGHGLELPILRYGEYMESGRFMNIKSLFGDYFDPLLKEWFNNTYPVETPIKTVTKEQD